MLSENHFDRLYEDTADPWGFGSRWYERRKREVLLSALPHRRYQRGLEAGCANGELAAALAPRCDSLLACDFHELALQLARRRLKDMQNVSIERCCLPGQWPEGSFDLIVISELGYYLTEPELRTLATKAQGSLCSSRGVLAACHWRRVLADARLDGDRVQRIFHEALGLDRIVRHEEADFLLELWSVDGRSVAQAEGLA